MTEPPAMTLAELEAQRDRYVKDWQYADEQRRFWAHEALRCREGLDELYRQIAALQDEGSEGHE